MAIAAAVPLLSLIYMNQSYRRNNKKKKHHSFSIFHSPQRSKLLTSFRSWYRTAGISHTTLPCQEPTGSLDSKIQEHCLNRNLEEAMESICSLNYNDFISLDSETFCYVLQLCSDIRSLRHGSNLHALISSYGIEIDSNLGSKIVSMYVNCGDVREGRRIFDKISFKHKPFLWNLLMIKYAKIGEYIECINLFQNMWENGTNPNSHTFSCVLKCFTSLGHLSHGMAVHGYLQKVDISDNSSAVGNALIAMYSKCNNISFAVKVFDKMPVRDVISWNSIIHGCVSRGILNKGVELFSEMLFLGMDVDLATLVSVLPALAEMGALAVGRALHGYSIKVGFVLEVTLNNSLLDMYSKCLAVENAVQIFERMSERTIVSWTSMISGYIVNAQYEKAITLFEVIDAENFEPDLYFICSALHACACSGSLDQGKLIHEYVVRNGLDSHIFVANALMDMYAKCGNMENARFVFERTVRKDMISWNTLIGGYAKNSLPNEALHLFVKMQLHMKPNSTTMTSVLRASASLSSLKKGREMHAHIIRAGIQECSFVVNALVDMYAKCGALVNAHRLFDLMGFKDLISWTVVISGYGMHGHGREALSLFKQMRRSGMIPDGVSFIAILYACSHSGLIDEGWRFFNAMRNEYKIEPTIEHYACMVDLLSRAGRLTKAFKFIESMPMEPNATVWGALLCGCRFHRDVKLAEKVAERIFELEPENTAYYIILANIYAEAEKWEAVKKLRERIRSKALRENPGCSWIEVKSKVHIFVTGDKSNSQSKKIESFLNVVRRKMKESGFVSRRNNASINADDIVKENALCGHSEKLAIAFGILNTIKGNTIRVAKNLRVCGDCHEVAKFISYMTGRGIILRDNNRFHHFQQGRCSCRGFW